MRLKDNLLHSPKPLELLLQRVRDRVLPRDVADQDLVPLYLHFDLRILRRHWPDLSGRILLPFRFLMDCALPTAPDGRDAHYPRVLRNAVEKLPFLALGHDLDAEGEGVHAGHIPVLGARGEKALGGGPTGRRALGLDGERHRAFLGVFGDLVLLAVAAPRVIEVVLGVLLLRSRDPCLRGDPLLDLRLRGSRLLRSPSSLAV